MKSHDLLSLIKKRRSRREFTRDEVPREVILKLVEAAQWAPSAGHTQPLEVVIVSNEKTRLALSRAALNQQSLISAPIVFAMCGDYSRVQARYGDRGRFLYVIQDIAAATQNLLLMAEACGLGAVWVGAFDEQEVSRILQLPETIIPFALIPVGYSQATPKPPLKRALQEIIHYESYKNKE